MVRRNNRRNDCHSHSLKTSSPIIVVPSKAPSSNVSVNADHVPCPLTDVLKKVFEKALDRTRHQLLSSGKIGLSVFFAYTNGMINVSSIFFKDELHEGLLRKRIREKALAENTSAVILLTEGERPGTIILTGVAPGIKASVRVDYVFDQDTGVITSWAPHWLDRPLKNAFLDGVFDT